MKRKFASSWTRAPEVLVDASRLHVASLSTDAKIRQDEADPKPGQMENQLPATSKNSHSRSLLLTFSKLSELFRLPSILHYVCGFVLGAPSWGLCQLLSMFIPRMHPRSGVITRMNLGTHPKESSPPKSLKYRIQSF